MKSFQPPLWHQELEFPYKAARMFCSNYFTCKQIYCVVPDDLIFLPLLEAIQYTLLKQQRFFILHDAATHSNLFDIEPLIESPVLFLLNIHLWEDSSSLKTILEKRSSRGMQTLLSATYPIDLISVVHSNHTLKRLLKDSITVFLPSSKMLTFKLFVYGTLKEGFTNHHYLKEATFLGKGQTRLRYPMILKHPAFPYLINKPKEGLHVHGELYEVNYQTLLAIDKLEGTPEHYTRREIEIVKNNNEIEPAWVYFVKEKIRYNASAFLECFEEEIFK